MKNVIQLRPVTPENWRPGLSVREDQRRFVSDSAGILARAYAYRESRSRAFVICQDETPVGMAMFYDLPEEQAYNFSQFFIDQRYQGQGIGTVACGVILKMMRDDGKYNRVVLCYVDGDDAARRLYEKFGFRLTGESDGDEIIMEMDLR